MRQQPAQPGRIDGVAPVEDRLDVAEPILSPEQFPLDQERRDTEDAAGERLLGLAGEAGLYLGVAGAGGTDAELRIRQELREAFAVDDRGAGVWLPSTVLYASGVA